MDSIRYEVLFDAQTLGRPIWFVLVLLLGFTAIGVVLVARPDLVAWGRLVRLGDARSLSRLFGSLVCAVSLLMLFGLVRGDQHERVRVRKAMRDRSYATVEGAITKFRPGNELGHVPEEFEVAGRHFSYREADWRYGVHRVPQRRRPLREGLYVKLSVLDDLIVRVEVRRP